MQATLGHLRENPMIIHPEMFITSKQCIQEMACCGSTHQIIIICVIKMFIPQ
jgi:hypothetical protein